MRVLLRFTDKGAKPEVQGRFVDGGKGSPAILLAEYGKGKVIWSGVRLSMSAAYDTTGYIAPFLANLLRELSGGQVVPRFTTQAGAGDNVASTESLVTEPEPYEVNPARLTPKGAADTPGKAEVLEADPANVDEFNLYGTLAAGAEATVYVAYHNAKWNRSVRLGKDTASIVRVDDGKTTVLRSVPYPAATGSRLILIKRRFGAIVAYSEGVVLISACDGQPMTGIVAQAGLTDVGYQPVESIYFTDGFARSAKAPNPWATVTGAWKMVQTEGEPTEGSNPFRYQGVASDDKPAIAVAGDWFWDDYSIEMSVFPDAAACGVIGHYKDTDHYLLVRLASAGDGKGTLSILRRTPTGNVEMATAPVACDRGRWYKLGLRATSGIVEGLLDGKAVASAPDRALKNGTVGMYVEGGKTQFDDVSVTSWRGLQRPVWGWGPWAWAPEGGAWSFDPKGGPDGALTAKASDGARAVTQYDGYADGSFEADLRPAARSEAGLFLRYEDARNLVLATLARDGSGKLVAALRQKVDGADKALGSAPVAGDADVWHRLGVLAVGHGFAVSVDGKPALQAYTGAAERGAVGLFIRGSGAFRDWSFMPASSGEDVNDTPTPSFAGTIDRNSWAARAGAWRADPAALDVFWHTGFFPGDVECRLGVYKSAEPVTTARLALSPTTALDGGYLLTATHGWSGTAVQLELSRAGKKVASGVAKLPSGTDQYCLTLRREGDLLVAGVGDDEPLAFKDPHPVAAPQLAFQITGGGLAHPDDTRVASTDLRNFTFDAAPTDWFISSGTWDITSRWPCTPGWAWFSGVSKKDALIRTKARVVGDQEVQFYAGAKALPAGEAMRDIIVGLCGSDDPGKGYRFTIESHSGGTFLTKDGKEVARAENFALSQAAIHFDWTCFTAKKEGNRVSLKWWGRTILEYEDPAPLEGGYVWLGTYNNGISIPRVTIYGRQE